MRQCIAIKVKTGPSLSIGIGPIQKEGEAGT